MTAPASHLHHHGIAPMGPQRPFVMALGITIALLAVEAVGGWLTGSLALLADAGHLLADVATLGIGFLGTWLASRPAPAQMSYGYRRAEILAAITNGLALWAVAGMIVYEAVRRFHTAHAVAAPGMVAVALLGLAGNLANGAVLGSYQSANLNLRVAFTHVVADTAAAVGTIAAGFVILATGWTQADAIASAGIAGLILVASWPLLREAVQILMEGAPAHLSLPEVAEAMLAVPDVAGVHDLHIWSLTSGMEAVSGHVVVTAAEKGPRVLEDLCRLLSTRYGLGHVTLQLETEHPADPLHPNCAPRARTGPGR
jgi:cobalt-zinc-cadmium efflux system protein